MPEFFDFTYKFALDVQHISKFIIGIGPLVGMVVGMITPFFYNKYIMHMESVVVIIITQIIVMVASSMCIVQASRLNLKLGIPDPVIYLGGSVLVEHLEVMIFMLHTRIITARMIPPGIEGTMMSFCSTIIHLDLFGLRKLMGLLVNKFIVGITVKNLEEKYIQLTLIKFFGACIPLAFIHLFMPTNKEIKEIQERNAKLMIGKEKEEGISEY